MSIQSVRFKYFFCLFLIAFLVGFARYGYARNATFAWLHSLGPNIAGYKIYYKYGSSGGPYNGSGATEGDSPVYVGYTTSYTLHGLADGATYYFVITAFDFNGAESDYSNEVRLAAVPGAAPVAQMAPAGENTSAEGAVGNGGDGGCFIATAAYGSYAEPHVMVLRNFRDRILLENRFGKAFVQLYYKYSPPLAAFIAKHDFLRAMIRITLLPVVGFSWLALHIEAVPVIALILFLFFCLLRSRFKAFSHT